MTTREATLLKYGVGLMTFFLAKALVQHALAPTPMPVSPLATAMEAEMDRQGFRAAFARRLGGTSNPLEAREIGLNLSRRGIARLDADHLEIRAALLLYIDSVAGDSICAARFEGTLAPAGLQPLLEALDPARMSQWAELSATSMRLELEASVPIAPANRSEIDSAFGFIGAAMPDAPRYRLANVLDNPRGATAHDRCWASREMAKVTLALPPPQRFFVLPTFAKVEAGL